VLVISDVSVHVLFVCCCAHNVGFAVAQGRGALGAVGTFCNVCYYVRAVMCAVSKVAVLRVICTCYYMSS
jgi:hypothetical protein